MPPRDQRSQSVGASAPQPQEAIPGLGQILDTITAGNADIRTKIDELKKTNNWGEDAVKKIELAGKVVGLAKAIVSKVDGSKNMNVTIANNVQDLTLELMTQSATDLHEETAGSFVTGPDIFISPAGVSTISSNKRDNSAAGNVNGVVYKAAAGSRFMKDHALVVAWDSPYAGKVHYYLGLEKMEGGWANGVPKDFLKKVVNSKNTGLMEARDGAGIAVFGGFSSEMISVIVEPDRVTG